MIMCDFQLLDRLSFIFVLIMIDDFTRRASQSHKSFFRAARFDCPVAAEILRPTFFQKHDPNLLSVRLGIERGCAFARKSIISFDDLPFTINE